MNTIIINTVIVLFAFGIWCINHRFEERDLERIEKAIEEEKKEYEQRKSTKSV